MINKKTMWKIITVTMVVLAVSILVTAVGGVVMLFGDKKPPVIEAVNGDVVTINAGDNFSFRNQVNVTDNSGKECTLEWTTNLKQDRAGTYKVKYTATDPAGNIQTFTLTVKVKEVSVQDDELMALVETFAKNVLKYTREEARANGYSKEKIVRDIHKFVSGPYGSSKNDANIYFSDVSNTPAQQQQAKENPKARIGWKTDWREEALRTLKMSRMEGDCYTYYSVSKAFFEYFVIDNVGIQRGVSSSLKGTHYWQIVNIGTDTDPKWYYYDSTRFAGTFTDGSPNACLVIEDTLLKYKASEANNYATDYYVIDKKNSDFFDADDNGGKFPKIETTKLS